MNNSNGKTRRLAGLALFTAIVVVLQLLGSFIKVGPFAVSLVLIPIVVGAAVYGVSAGASCLASSSRSPSSPAPIRAVTSCFPRARS